MDFSLILFVATLVCGVIWGLDAWLLVPRRRLAAAAATEAGQPAAAEAALKEPGLVEQAKAFFPILLAIFLLRSFLFEPFRIPSGSMKPTLVEGDFILVNKYTYGIRLPVINKKIFDINTPERGDVVVFRFPHNPSQDYIKRLVGLPGDRIAYDGKTIYIQPACPSVTVTPCPEAYAVPRQLEAAGGFITTGLPADVYTEKLGEREHKMLIIDGAYPMQRYWGDRAEWVVPEGHYFMMGDNRDQSSDSRFWGFVPEDHLKGEAVAVWLHLDFGLDIPFLGWVPTGVSFSRVGGIE